MTVDTFFRHMRCICTATVQEEIVNLGKFFAKCSQGLLDLVTCQTALLTEASKTQCDSNNWPIGMQFYNIVLLVLNFPKFYLQVRF